MRKLHPHKMRDFRKLRNFHPANIITFTVYIIMYLFIFCIVSPISGTDSDFDTYVDELRQLCDTSSILKVAEGLILIQKRDYLKARGLMRQGKKQNVTNICQVSIHIAARVEYS